MSPAYTNIYNVIARFSDWSEIFMAKTSKARRACYEINPLALLFTDKNQIKE